MNSRYKPIEPAADELPCPACGEWRHDPSCELGALVDGEPIDELPGCPVLIAGGLYELDAVDRDAADRMLLEHLADETRTCCDSEGFAIAGLPFESARKPAQPASAAAPARKEIA